MGAVVVIVIGVSGSGKSTVGRALANALEVPFLDGDELHTDVSVAKMVAGHPLSDEDRLPWLASLAVRIGEMAAAEGGVIACSALKRKYRDALLAAAPTVRFLQLAVDEEDARERVAARTGHFMSAALVASQFGEYEPLQRGEPGIIVDAMRELADKIEAFEEYLSSPARRSPEGEGPGRSARLDRD